MLFHPNSGLAIGTTAMYQPPFASGNADQFVYTLTGAFCD
jgi:hypothetical protein